MVSENAPVGLASGRRESVLSFCIASYMIYRNLKFSGHAPSDQRIQDDLNKRGLGDNGSTSRSQCESRSSILLVSILRNTDAA